MNLLIDNWIPVRPRDGGKVQIITLQTLSCNNEQWRLSLPRDDMELATLALLICLWQILAPPKNDDEYRNRVRFPLTEDEFQKFISPWMEKFCLNHPTYPFMQVKGVKASEATSMDKLLTGVSGATNCAFINQPLQGEALCSGCTAIALFNQANNAPGFGGGFKSGLRGGTPVTTFIQGNDLRTTVWMNVLTGPRLQKYFPDEAYTENQPTWVKPVKPNKLISASAIGLARGLFWQPAHIELCPPVGSGKCTCCGQPSHQRYIGFLKEKFNFTLNGLWPHPHSPRLVTVKKGSVEERFLAFTTSAPSWTQIGRILVDKIIQKENGNRVATVVNQFRHIAPQRGLELVVGGYRNNQASILERRHDVLIFTQGWQQHSNVINEIVEAGLSYKTALRKALYTFSVGVKNAEFKGAGVSVHEVAERRFYRRSELLIPEILASINFSQADMVIRELRGKLHQLCETLFNESVAPYAHHPKLISTLAIARASFYKHLRELQPQGGLLHE
ncbi:type I-E CRISPR-associated protein Cse1/CasA [Salmonella enterica subsp. enterica]|uniref:CRISPR-associated protein CasA n=1 Tax=Salmonella enterica TaxID=28901 RepID=A0A7D8EU74_SALER|nr:type I-E CRISPR-associated protein Cse1/CasA [Salmonella enterica subsp. enterica serovar Amherstiana]SUF97950.1 CRISPR-associated protein CasA [Salmonella enterica]